MKMVEPEMDTLFVVLPPQSESRKASGSFGDQLGCWTTYVVKIKIKKYTCEEKKWKRWS